MLVCTVPVLVQGWILVLTVVFSGVDTGTVFGQCCGAGPFFYRIQFVLPDQAPAY